MTVFASEGHNSVVVAAIFGSIMALNAMLGVGLHQKCLRSDDT